MKLMYFAAVLAAFVVPASAQVVTSPTKIVDTNADGFIKLEAMAAKVMPKVKKGTTVAVCTEVAPFTYAVKGTPCPSATPDPVTPPPVVVPSSVVPGVRTVIAGGDGYIWNGRIAIGVGPFGSLGTLYAAPSGVPTDTATGLKRVGVFAHAAVPKINDVLLQGRAVEIFAVAHRTGPTIVRRANAQLTGFTQIAGKLTAEPSALTWQGETAEKLAIRQRITIDSERTIIDVDLTNRSGADMLDLRYMRAIDPDQSDRYDTTNEVVERGRAKVTLAGGSIMLIGSDDPRATISMAASVPPSMDPHAMTALPVGTKRKADDSIHVVFDIGKLAVGASTSLRIVYEGPRFAS